MTTRSARRALRPTPDPSDARPRRAGLARTRVRPGAERVPADRVDGAAADRLRTRDGAVGDIADGDGRAARPRTSGALKQGVFAVIGIPLMFVASRLPVAFWKKMAWPALIGATLFQLLVFVPGLGVEATETATGSRSPGFQFQPAEFLKLALALWIGYVLLPQADPARPLAPRLHPGRARRMRS